MSPSLRNPSGRRANTKYLHRKDLPSFVVEEGAREHAAEFAAFARLVTLDTKEPIERVRYSEKFQWERRSFDQITHSVAQYYKSTPRWVLISAFGGGVDGRRNLTYCSLVRHFMDHCETWSSSYRLVLGVIREIDVHPEFNSHELLPGDDSDAQASSDEAVWDVVFVRLSALQEYGWHAGLERLMWASDEVNGGLADFDWPELQKEFARLRDSWIELVIEHAKQHGEFFPPPELSTAESYEHGE